MRSMPQALLWETLSHGRWVLPSSFLLGNLLPLLTYGALSGFPFNAKDHEFVVLQFAFLPIVIFQFALGIALAQGPLSRLYATPISASSIVAWHMLSGAVILAAETLAAAWLYNSLFHVGWPYLGPALFAAAAWSAFQVLLCANIKSSLRGTDLSVFFPNLLLAGLPGVLLCGWINSRYGSWLSPPTHYWNEVTAIEFVTLVIAFGLCCMLSYRFVSRNRCDEPLRSWGLSKWLANQWDQFASSRRQPRPFRSAAHAHFWYEWTMKGYALPLGTLFILALAVSGGLGAWWLQHCSLNNLHEGVLVLGGASTLLAMVAGFALGVQFDMQAVGQRESRLGDTIQGIEFESLGSFLGSRPIACSDLAKATLKTAALSVLIAWGMWFLVYVAIRLLLWMYQELPNALVPPKIGNLYFPLTILGPWITMTGVAAIGLTGRGAKILMAGIALLVGILAVALSSAVFQWMPSTAVVICYSAGSWTVSVLVSLFTLWAFFHAQRKGHLSYKTSIASAIAFVAIAVLGIVYAPATMQLAKVPLAFALAALAVMPIATFPIAIAWNRHR